MKIKKSYLQEIIKEEIQKEINEGWRNKLAGLALGASALMGGLAPTDAEAKPAKELSAQAAKAQSLGQIQGDKIILNQNHKDSWKRLQMAELIANSQGKTITRYRSETTEDGKPVFTGVEFRIKGTY